MRLLKQDLVLPGLHFGWDLLLPTAPPSVHPIPEFSCLALLPRNQSSSPAAWGGDWQMHTGWLSRRRVGVGIQRQSDGTRLSLPSRLAGWGRGTAFRSDGASS